MILPQVKERMEHQAFPVEVLVVVQVQAAAQVQAVQVQVAQVRVVQVLGDLIQAPEDLARAQVAQAQVAQVQAARAQVVQAQVAQVPDLALRAAQPQLVAAHGNVILLAGGMNILMEAISRAHGQSLKATGITSVLMVIWLLMNGSAATGSVAVVHGPILIKAHGM